MILAPMWHMGPSWWFECAAWDPDTQAINLRCPVRWHIKDHSSGVFADIAAGIRGFGNGVDIEFTGVPGCIHIG